MIKVVITDDKMSFYAEAKFNSMEEARVFARCHPLARAPHIVRYLHSEEDITPTSRQKLELERKRVLSASDWLMLPDVKLDQKHRKIYQIYRQYVRDLRLGVDDKVEDFDHWLRRTHPEEFMDGGSGAKIVSKFKTYY